MSKLRFIFSIEWNALSLCLSGQSLAVGDLIIQPIMLLKNNGTDQKCFFKKRKIKIKFIFQSLDKLRGSLLVDILPSEHVVILKR